MTYTQAEELKAMFAALLAKSTDSATATDVHPSFVEVIKQLTPGEARILALLGGEVRFSHFHPDIDGPGAEGFAIFPGQRHFTDLAIRSRTAPSQLSLAISNLRRHNLAELSQFDAFQLVTSLDAPAVSRLLAGDPALKAKVDECLVAQVPLRADTMNLLLTPFGRSLRGC